MSQNLPPESEIDPELREFVTFLRERTSRYPLSKGLTVAERRRIAEEVRLPLRSGGPFIQDVYDHTVSNGKEAVRVRIINAAPGDQRPALIYLHGGGWMLFSVDTHDRLMRELAAAAGIAVVGIDYSLAPDARYPTQLDEIASVLSWLRDRGSGVGIDPERLAIGGDSVGANLSVATCLRLRESEPVSWMRGMLLCYGVYDSEFDTDSYRRYADPSYVLSRDEMREFWDCYVRTAADRDDPLASPLRADLAGLPPAMMVITEHDVLHDENISMAEKLRAAGIEVTSNVYAGTIHSFLEAVSMADISRQAVADAGAWLRERLSQE